MIVASFLSPRPAEFGGKANAYGPYINLLQASCDRQNVRHICITEPGSQIPDGIERYDALTADLPLMRAIILAQLEFLADRNTPDGPIVMVGADCLIGQNLAEVFVDADWDVGVTIRQQSGDFNNGAVYLRNKDAGITLYAKAAQIVGEKWGGDQDALQSVISPICGVGRTTERQGFKTRAFPCETHNRSPMTILDGEPAYILHFKGNRKDFMAAWAEKWMGLSA